MLPLEHFIAHGFILSYLEKKNVVWLLLLHDIVTHLFFDSAIDFFHFFLTYLCVLLFI